MTHKRRISSISMTEKRISELEKDILNYSLSLSEYICPRRVIGRKGQIVDTVIFGFTGKDDSFHSRFTVEKQKAPHYVIMRNGSVRQYVNLTDSSEYFTTSVCRSSAEYYSKAKGIISVRPVNVALYSVSVLFEGVCVNDEQILAAAALLRVIGMKVIRVYGKKLSLDANHIISASFLPDGSELNIPTGLLIALCKKRPL